MDPSPSSPADAADLAAPRPRKALAVASLVLALIPVLSVLGLVLSLIALHRASHFPERFAGRSIAIAAFLISLVTGPLLCAGVVPVWQSRRLTPFAAITSAPADTRHLIAIGAALTTYSQQNNGTLPDTDNWERAVRQLHADASILVSPNAAPADVSYYYVPLGDLSSLPSPATTVMAYTNPDHYKGLGGVVLFADGSVRWIENPAFQSTIDAIVLPDGTPYTPHLKPPANNP